MSSKRGRKPKYSFTILLSGINARQVYKKFKQPSVESGEALDRVTSCILEYSNKANDESTTQVTELSVKRKPTHIFFNPKEGKSITMIDHVNFGCLPERTDIRCFHDHHTFNTSPIGLPIKFIQKKSDKKQASDSHVTGTNEYFLTFGIFCSFACCLGFLKEHEHCSMYRNSKHLLYSLYYKLYQTELNVSPAPSWECLKDYGGDQSFDITEFRKSFCSCNYTITENIKRPFMVAVGKYIEERRCGYL